MNDDARQRVARGARLLRDAERPVRVLRSLAWPEDVKQRFLASGGLPQVSYPRPDLSECFALLARARTGLDADSPPERWLLRQADAIESGARMLLATGTAEFFEHSASLYGRPRDPLPDGLGSALELAHHFDHLLGGLSESDLGAPPVDALEAQQVADAMRRAAHAHFAERAPRVSVVDNLSANAVAGPQAIRIRRGAQFNDRDVTQLIQHEALIHVGTSLNGYGQDQLPILAASHPGTTRTQEGLAVFAEFISGAMDADRLRRLANRVIAIDMAIEGADFVQVYRFFEATGIPAGQAFENTRRVFRGGLPGGGAPFTKDVVYLDGLVRVHCFLRTLISAGRPDVLHLLFCGKLDIDDLPALAQLAADGLCRAPRFLPPWAADLRFLVAYLAYSTFLGNLDVGRMRTQFNELLSATTDCPAGF